MKRKWCRQESYSLTPYLLISKESMLPKYLSNLTIWLYVLGGRHYAEATIEIDGRENHSLTLDTHHLTRRKVGNEEDALAYKVFGIVIIGCDA